MALNPHSPESKISDPPVPNEYFKHFRGALYKVEKLAKDCETFETVVIYYAVRDRETFVRKLSDWLKPKIGDSKEEIKRFTRVKR